MIRTWINRMRHATMRTSWFHESARDARISRSSGNAGGSTITGTMQFIGTAAVGSVAGHSDGGFWRNVGPSNHKFC